MKTFPTSTALNTKKVDFRLILTILISLFAVLKLATQLLHSQIFLTHLISAILGDCKMQMSAACYIHTTGHGTFPKNFRIHF